MKGKTVQPVKTERWWLYIIAAITVFFILSFENNGSYYTQKVVGLLGAVAVLCGLLFADKQRVKRLLTPPAFAVFAYMLLAGISTLYARSGKFAIAEFACLLAAFAVFMVIVLYAQDSKTAFRRTAAVLACAAAPVGVLSIDAASSNILMRPFRVLMEAIGAGYGDTGSYFYSRLHTIFGNPNTYAGLMSIACLLSLWLVLTAESRKQKILCTILLMINAVSYLLAFSMGSLGVFVVACLLMLALSPKEQRTGFLLLLVQTAAVALVVGAVSVKGFGDTVTGSPLPILMLVLGCAAACALEVCVRDKASAVLSGKGKILLAAIAGIVVVVVVYLIAALSVTGAYTFGTEGDFRRTADLGAGDYTLTIEASAPVGVRVAYKNTNNLIQNNETDVARGTSDAPITFSVPEDSELVFFYFSSSQPGTTVSSAAYDGTESGSIKLGYKLLPAFIADRIQDLSANGNVVQRRVYWQDAIKLWQTAPVFGRGLGGFENGVVSVQDYYYETKYAHNHYVEALCDLGVLGLVAFLAVLGTAVWALVKSRKQKPLMVMLLGACVVQMFGQAISDVTWSVGGCLPMFLAVLALITLYCGDCLRIKVPEGSKGGAVRWPVAAVSAVFIVLIGLNLMAQSIFYGNGLTLDKLKTCAKIDLFEKNDYKLTYLLSGGNEEGVADRYAADLAATESNSITIPLAQYYAGTGQYTKALDTLDQGTEYMRADKAAWQQMFDVYESIIDPVGQFNAVQLFADDSYIQRMVAGYEKLRQVNAEQLDEVLLTAKNNAFLNKLLAVAALEPYNQSDALSIFSNLGLDTATAPDVNGDGVPDCATVQEGEVVWNEDGSFTAQTDSLVLFSTVTINEGLYRLTIQSSDKTGAVEGYMGGNAVAIDAATGESAPIQDLGGAFEGNVSVRVKAGTTVDRVTYNRG
ncbi:O-antigen ligase family protein [Candidatus Agathobaculum pullicola]|uniref:O-antigen ligase family protein n=1 Tax=Candidatus Agathobaculum pullicola TaxID=2838426 RepID=UPI003F8E5211